MREDVAINTRFICTLSWQYLQSRMLLPIAQRLAVFIRMNKAASIASQARSRVPTPCQKPWRATTSRMPTKASGAQRIGNDCVSTIKRLSTAGFFENRLIAISIAVLAFESTGVIGVVVRNRPFTRIFNQWASLRKLVGLDFTRGQPHPINGEMSGGQ